MKIGIDFDNTIVNYDFVFHTVAKERNLIPHELQATKQEVKYYIKENDKHDEWTEIQGYVYGARMGEATPYAGVISFFRFAQARGHQIIIISHKTRHPFLGPRYDLHEAASAWIRSNIRHGDKQLITMDSVFFELTKEEKIARITSLGCDYFIDDLPEILDEEGFPDTTIPILFNPDGLNQVSNPRVSVQKCWDDIQDFFQSI